MLTLLESLSLSSSSNPREDEVLPVGSSHAISQSSNAQPMTSPPEARAEENVDTVESSNRRSILKKWLQRKSEKSSAPHKPDRLSGKSRKPADHPSPSHSPSRVDDRHEGPSTMAAGQRKRVSVCPRLTMGNLTYRSEQLQKLSDGHRFVVPQICMQGLITRYRINHVARPLFLRSRTKTLLKADNVPRI